MSIRASVGRGGVNQRTDVETVQRLLNQNIPRVPTLTAVTVNGSADEPTVAAIEEFQRRVVLLPNPDGRVDPGGRTLRALTGASAGTPLVEIDLSQAPWIGVARGETGQTELRGAGQNNPRILEYIATFPYLARIWNDDHTARMGDVDETPWCACFVNWALIRAGKAAGPSARARDWLNYGERLETPRPGCIAVVYHQPDSTTAGTTSSGNHVAFFMGAAGNGITLLGGNQGNRVSERTYRNYWTVLGYRWPS